MIGIYLGREHETDVIVFETLEKKSLKVEYCVHVYITSYQCQQAANSKNVIVKARNEIILIKITQRVKKQNNSHSVFVRKAMCEHIQIVANTFTVKHFV